MQLKHIQIQLKHMQIQLKHMQMQLKHMQMQLRLEQTKLIILQIIPNSKSIHLHHVNRFQSNRFSRKQRI